MTNYPNSLDDDTTIYRIDDNVTEIDGTTPNQERDAIFAIEKTLGVNPQGTKDSVADRIDVSINKDGYLRSDAVQAVGLVSLPVTDNQVGINAGIKESKLDLKHSTSDLFALGQNTLAIVNGIEGQVEALETELLEHVAGSKPSLRHKASAIDLDTAIVTGNTSNLNTGVHALDSTLQDHIGINKVGAHTGENISLDTSNFVEIPHSANNVQDAIAALDNMDAISMGTHRATMHGNGIPRTARVTTFLDGYLTGPADGYSDNYDDIVVPSSLVNTYLADTVLSTVPKDDFSTGDDIIDFSPSVSSVLFQTQFAQARVGDWIYIDYGNGLSAKYLIDSLYFDPNTSQARVRINGTNLCQSTTAKAIIFKMRYDDNTFGVLSVSPVNTDLSVNGNFIPGSVVVADPRGACALGTFFDPKQLDATHYNLYLQIYFTGAPTSNVSSYQKLPAIDVTGNKGITPWAYTLESVVQATNKSLRTAGFNYRMTAFAKDGKFGIMMADVIDKASFSIITYNAGNDLNAANANYPNNVIGASGNDGLGLGPAHANLASVAYNGVPANYSLGSTLILTPRHKRTYVVNGAQLDYLAPAPTANTDGYFYATVNNVRLVGTGTEVQYYIVGDHAEAGFKPGMTIVVASMSYDNFDYTNFGRFIIKDVLYAPPCTNPGDVPSVLITVINGIHGAASSKIPFPNIIGMPVRVYFGNDSISFDRSQIIDDSSGLTMHRLYEIYVTDKKTTFAHERARIQRPRPPTDGTAPTPLVDNWHIRYISPKFRGTSKTIPTSATPGEWVGFYVKSYDDVLLSGEFTVQLCRADDITTLLGPAVTCRKNIPFKLYGYNGPDYIEMEYVESGSTPTTIEKNLCANIQLFSSLSTDEELLMLASCEVNWMNGGQPVVNMVTDRRQFGNINERDFTNSAQDFINAVSRAYMPNGVIRGLDFVTNTPNTITISGGSAVVNGSVVNVNDSTIYLAALSAPINGQSLVLICVDSNGNIVSKIMTGTKEQVFNSGKFVETVTFTEVVDYRKDLLPLYIVTVNGGPQTFVSYKGVKKYVAGNPTPNLVLKSDSINVLGNFSSFDNALNYAYYYDNQSYLEVVGTNIINHTLVVDIGAKNLKITGNGSGTILSTIQDENPTILIKNAGSLTFDSLNLVSTNKHDVDGYVNAQDGGFIVATNDGVTVSGFYELFVRNCIFTGDSRPPSIVISDGGLGTFDSLIVENNTFSSSKSAICIYGAGTGYYSGGLLQMYSVIIKNNNGHGMASCMIGSVSPSLGTNDMFPVIDNLVIEGNNFSVINASCSRESHISITDNTAKIIANNLCLTKTGGNYYFDQGLINYTNGLGNAEITGNLSSTIQFIHISKPGTTYVSSAHVSGNTLKSYSSVGFWNLWYGIPQTSTIAISLKGSNYTGGFQASNVAICEGNIITSADGSKYGIGIEAINTNIMNNMVESFTLGGIFSKAYDETNTFVMANRVSRVDSQQISYFIRMLGTAAVICTNNVLSHKTVDKTSPSDITGNTNTILYRSSPYDIVEDNYNCVYDQETSSPGTPVSPTTSSSIVITGIDGYLEITDTNGHIDMDGNNAILNISGTNAKINANDINVKTLEGPSGVITVTSDLNAPSQTITCDTLIANNIILPGIPIIKGYDIHKTGGEGNDGSPPVYYFQEQSSINTDSQGIFTGNHTSGIVNGLNTGALALQVDVAKVAGKYIICIATMDCPTYAAALYHSRAWATSIVSGYAFSIFIQTYAVDGTTPSWDSLIHGPNHLNMTLYTYVI